MCLMVMVTIIITMTTYLVIIPVIMTQDLDTLDTLVMDMDMIHVDINTRDMLGRMTNQLMLNSKNIEQVHIFCAIY